MFKIGPQIGPQEQFLASPADIAIIGGAVGGGKTYGLTLESMRHVDVPGFNAIVFRRLSGELTGGGSIWQEAHGLYPIKGAIPREGEYMDWRFPSGATVEFCHLQQMKHIKSHLSKQYALVLWDQLEQFEPEMFWELYGRNRSVCGVEPYMRGACNPDPDCFLYENGNGLIAWWIDPMTGYAIPERSGVLRWFVRDHDDELIWADSAEELRQKAPHICDEDPKAPTSITFIPATLDDNPALTEKDPKYKSRMLLQNKVQRERKLRGNWKVRAVAGSYFQRRYFEMVDAPPVKVRSRVRAWDKAATKPNSANPDPDWTVGVKYSQRMGGGWCIEHVERLREGPLGVEKAVCNMAEQDGHKCKVGLWQDPGGDGKAQAQHFTRLLNGFVVKTIRAKEDKETYAGPCSAQAEAGNIQVVRGAWNEAFFNVLEGFPDGRYKDDVDALSLAHILSSNTALDRLRGLATM